MMACATKSRSYAGPFFVFPAVGHGVVPATAGFLLMVSRSREPCMAYVLENWSEMWLGTGAMEGPPSIALMAMASGVWGYGLSLTQVHLPRDGVLARMNLR